jgi:hypothetical protein
MVPTALVEALETVVIRRPLQAGHLIQVRVVARCQQAPERGVGVPAHLWHPLRYEQEHS